MSAAGTDPGDVDVQPAPRWADLGLICLTCRAPIESTGTALACRNGHQVAVVDGIPRFVASESYARSFGFEWTRHRHTQLDSRSGRRDSHQTFAAKVGLGPEQLEGRSCLDIGVGSGRFAEVAAEYGAKVVGIDLSRAVEAAAENLAGRALIAQADVFDLPFDRSFDVVYSIGVLHHTPDTRAAVRAAARVVKPGGWLAIWVYRRTWHHALSDLYRRVTTRLSEPQLYRLCRLLARVQPLYQVPILGRVVRFLLPVSGQRDFEWRVLDTFDWYAPRFQWKHSEAEVVGWFRDLGFESIEVLGVPVAVRGRVPATGLRPTGPA